MKKNYTQIFFLLALFALCVVSAFGATYSWLATNRAVKAQDIGMQIRAKGVIIVRADMYRCDETTLITSDPSYTIAPRATSSPYNYSMEPFDSIIIGNNNYHGLILAAELTNIDINTINTITAELICTGNLTASDGKSIEKCTSNIVYAGYCTEDELKATFPAAADFFTDSVTDAQKSAVLNAARFLIQTTPRMRKSFVTRTEASSSKEDTLQLSIPVTESVKSMTDTEMVYILIDYDPRLIDSIGFGSQLFTNTLIPYTNDLTAIVFS